MVRCSVSAIVLLLAAAGSLQARDAEVAACLDRPSTAEQRECVDALYRAANAELEATLRRVLEVARRGDEGNVRPGAPRAALLAPAIERAQEAWLAYREAECGGIVGRLGGTGAQGWLVGCLAEKTRERIVELRVPFYQR